MKNIIVLLKKSPYLIAFVIVSAACFLSYALNFWFLPGQGVLLIFQLAVIITALPGNKRSAIFAGVLSGVTFNYFFTTPRFSLHMSNIDDIVNLLIFLIIAVITSYLAAFYRTQQEALKRAELRASILMSVSHDLRTPLSTIIGTLSTLQAYEDKLPKQEKAELLSGALEESHRLHRYIENLLQATKLQQGIKLNAVYLDVSNIVNKVVTRFTSNRLKIVQTDDLPMVYASAYLLEQAIYNVVDNALKYSPKETTVTITCLARDNTVVIDILDLGPGINGKDKNAVFDLFFSTRQGDSGEGGTGIGLTVAKGLIEAHKGSISIQPASKGCTVRIILPSVDESKYE